MDVENRLKFQMIRIGQKKLREKNFKTDQDFWEENVFAFLFQGIDTTHCIWSQLR